MPPVDMSEKYPLTHAVYKNEHCNGRIYQACFNLNNIQLEIVGPVDGEPSAWREYLDKHGEGLHHLALYTKDIDRAIAEFSNEGIDVSQRGYWPAEPKDGAYAYLETYDELKCVVELLSF
jgi:hypothetical protein